MLTSQFANTNPTVATILTPFPAVWQAQFFANAVDTDTTGARHRRRLGHGRRRRHADAHRRRELLEDRSDARHIPESLVAKFGADTDAAPHVLLRSQRAEPPRGFGAAPEGLRRRCATRSRGSRRSCARTTTAPSTTRPTTPINDETFGAKLLFDVDLGYQATKNLYFGIGADNLFNTFPDRQTKDANISFGRFIYSRNVSQFGMNGGFYYGKLQLTFF